MGPSRPHRHACKSPYREERLQHRKVNKLFQRHSVSVRGTVARASGRAALKEGSMPSGYVTDKKKG